MRDVPGVADVQISREGNYPQWSVVVDREKAATAGLSQRDVAQAALFSLNSNVSVNPSIFTDPRTGNQYNIVVQLDEPFRVRPEDLGKIFVTAAGGPPHRRCPPSPTSSGAWRRSRSSGSTSSAWSGSRGTRSAAISAPISDDIESRLGALQLPPGFSVQMGGQTAQQREAFSSLTFMSILALMLVYMVMASQFRSLKDPFIIMFSVPMGLIGVILAPFPDPDDAVDHLLHGHHHDGGDRRLERRAPDRVHERAAPPRPGARDAVVRAGRTRLRPILMTSLTTIFGLSPMALGWLVGGEANAPLARAVIGGLAVSTGLTLVLIPTLYTILEERFPRHLALEEEGAA